MKYTSCDWINGGLDFRPDCIVLCCFSWLQGYEEYVLVDNYHGEKIDWSELFEKKRNLINLQKQGKTADFCKSCVYQESYDWDDDDSINCLLLNHWTNCNSACIYCDFGNEREYYNKNQAYDILPILEEMKEKNILKLTERSFVSFGGGEPTVLKNFDNVLKFLVDFGFKNIRINSSGIKYSAAIENGIKQGRVDVVISVDAGSSQIYKNIKRVDCFDKVWQNIANYAKSALEKNRVKAKYIIVPNVNDSQKDIDEFLNCAAAANLSAISFSVEKYWSTTETEKLVETEKAKQIYELLLYAENRAKQLNFEIELYSEAIGFKNLMKDNK